MLLEAWEFLGDSGEPVCHRPLMGTPVAIPGPAFLRWGFTWPGAEKQNPRSTQVRWAMPCRPWASVCSPHRGARWPQTSIQGPGALAHPDGWDTESTQRHMARVGGGDS